MSATERQPALTSSEAAAALGCSLQRIYQLLQSGLLPGAQKHLGRWLIPASTVRAARRRLPARSGRTEAPGPRGMLALRSSPTLQWLVRTGWVDYSRFTDDEKIEVKFDHE